MRHNPVAILFKHTAHFFVKLDTTRYNLIDFNDNLHMESPQDKKDILKLATTRYNLIQDIASRRAKGEFIHRDLVKLTPEEHIILSDDWSVD